MLNGWFIKLCNNFYLKNLFLLDILIIFIVKYEIRFLKLHDRFWFIEILQRFFNNS